VGEGDRCTAVLYKKEENISAEKNSLPWIYIFVFVRSCHVVILSFISVPETQREARR
jgi:hypothetical protein